MRARPGAAHEQHHLEVPPGRPLCLAIVSDSHSKPHRATNELVARVEPDAILHAGDVGAMSVLDPLREIAPLYAVRGNIDDHVLADSMLITIADGERTLLKILLTHIALAGTKLRADATRLAKAHGAELVVCGHSHMPFIGKDRGLVLFNPGSVGPRRFGLPIVFGVARVSPAAVDLTHISCETGERWRP
ncbi:MAG: metallophosphoesterase family protein [Myxococcales bacterium]|nr:metallophosphoesterase family protein [Myxococcales bacterium]